MAFSSSNRFYAIISNALSILNPLLSSKYVVILFPMLYSLLYSFRESINSIGKKNNQEGIFSKIVQQRRVIK
jgi:hypothetical protein